MNEDTNNSIIEYQCLNTKLEAGYQHLNMKVGLSLQPSLT
ncbi:22227_t:CDS:2 [Dentiscutata erythropus]|uniref:22227_t:CDS:1 n=1 Tax=Dentiscutata erythropus TaxID=1348616 RepID=A0A9N9C816_9GLOM|nr:22227_t:CDS:2 [Dentiscutata erythropus]